jgi:hypothetical protein
VKFRDPFYYLIHPSTDLPSIGHHAKFRAVVILEADYPTSWQVLVSEWLVQAGCLAMMAWGPNCTTWDDSVDWASIKAHNWQPIPDEEHVMTTWHDDQSLEDVFWFCQFCAEHPDYGLEDTLLIHVGTTDRGAEFHALFVHSRDLAEREAGDQRSIH